MPRRLKPGIEENRKRVQGLINHQIPPAEITDSAACSGLGLNYYSKDPVMRKACLTVCAGCPVRRDCLIWALWSMQTQGIWGGRSDMELRRALSVTHSGEYRDMRRPVRCPDCSCVSLVVTIRIYKCTECELEWPRVRPKRTQRQDLVPVPVPVPASA